MIRFVIALAFLAWFSGSASAYVTFGQGYGSKWGDPNFGTPGVVTWGFMQDGTGVDPNFRMDPWSFPNSTGLAGTSQVGQLRARVDAAHGVGAFNAAITRAMNTWSTVANITFVGPQSDNGAPFASPGAISPDIRIGAFTPQSGHSFNGVGAVGFGPPGPFGNDPLAGDIIFNLSASFYLLSGIEDQTPLPPFGNDLENLTLHELGHAAFGLGHPPWEGDNPDQRVMYVGGWPNPSAPPCCQTLNHFPAPDDIAGAQYVYGVPASSTLPGDIDRDFDVDRRDVADFVSHLGRPTGSLWATGNFNADGRTSLSDLMILQGRLGQTHPSPPASAEAVPEPATCSLVVLGFAMTTLFRVRCGGATPRRGR